MKPKNRQDLIWDVAKDVALMNSTEAEKKSGSTVCLDYTCVSKYLGMSNTLIKHRSLLLFFHCRTQGVQPVGARLRGPPTKLKSQAQAKIKGGFCTGTWVGELEVSKGSQLDA